MRVFRPIVRHVQERVGGEAHRFTQWNDLHDDDRISAEQADSWLIEASRELRDPVLGLNALTALRRGAGDVVELAAECAPTLRAALDTLIRFLPLVYEAASFHLHVKDEMAALSLRYAIPISHLTRDFVLGFLLHGVRSWLGGVAGIQLWLVDAAPRTAAVYEAAFTPLDVRFGANADAIAFPAALLDEPMRRADPVLYAVLSRFAERQVVARARDTSLAEQVRRLLSAVLSSTNGNAHGVAKTLGLSQRALARRLQQEGVTFTDLVEDVRKERALHYVEHSNLAPHQIARMLGYGSTATFCRAFVRWQGRSPLSHRNAHNARN